MARKRSMGSKKCRPFIARIIGGLAGLASRRLPLHFLGPLNPAPQVPFDQVTGFAVLFFTAVLAYAGMEIGGWMAAGAGRLCQADSTGHADSGCHRTAESNQSCLGIRRVMFVVMLPANFLMDHWNMSVRRLAAVQPATFAFTAQNEAWAKAQIAKYPAGRQASAVIPLLWRAQAQNDYWLPKPAIEKVGEMLDMPTIRVLEIATFYSMFNLEPVGKHFIQLCGTTPCALRGAEAIKDVCRQKIGEQRVVSADGNFSWLEVECLGACCNAPMVQINDDYYEDLTPGNFAKLLDDLAAGKPAAKGSQSGRHRSEPAGGEETLLDAGLYDGSAVGTWKKRFEEEAAKAANAAADTAPKVAVPVVPSSPAAAPAPGAVPVTTQTKADTASTAPASAPAAASAPTDTAAREALAKQEEAAVAAKLATLPKDATPEQKANAVGAKPAGLAAPRAAKADDLKRIKGIGPVNEGKLNGLGIYHFDQIADWTRTEIAWVGTYLAFPGRIDREDWLAQAVLLAKGRDTEVSKRVDKGEVPSSEG